MEELRAGIVTFHRATNYGAILQAYALQVSLFKLGVRADIVDNRNDRIDVKYSNFNPKLFNEKGKLTFNSVKTYLSQTLKLQENIYKRNLFDSFIAEYLKISKTYSSRDELLKDENNYDFFICGSDQVWNLGVTHSNGIYFLDFTSAGKRNSYAASLGSATVSKENIDVYKKFLRGFHKISLREESSIEIVEKAVERHVQLVLDPTFLLKKEDWEACSSSMGSLIPEGYIFFYELYDLKNEAIHNFVTNLSKITDLQVVHVGHNRNFKYKNCRDVVPSPDQWVWLIKNARFVVTNSFHGTAFSINFHKDFFTGLLNPESRPANVRMKDILQKAGLKNRLIDYTAENVVEKMITGDINWYSVDEKLDVMRADSSDFLKNMITNYRHEGLIRM